MPIFDKSTRVGNLICQCLANHPNYRYQSDHSPKFDWLVSQMLCSLDRPSFADIVRRLDEIKETWVEELKTFFDLQQQLSLKLCLDLPLAAAVEPKKRMGSNQTTPTSNEKGGANEQRQSHQSDSVDEAQEEEEEQEQEQQDKAKEETRKRREEEEEMMKMKKKKAEEEEERRRKQEQEEQEQKGLREMGEREAEEAEKRRMQEAIAKLLPVYDTAKLITKARVDELKQRLIKSTWATAEQGDSNELKEREERARRPRKNMARMKEEEQKEKAKDSQQEVEQQQPQQGQKQKEQREDDDSDEDKDDDEQKEVGGDQSKTAKQLLERSRQVKQRLVAAGRRKLEDSRQNSSSSSSEILSEVGAMIQALAEEDEDIRAVISAGSNQPST